VPLPISFSEVLAGRSDDRVSSWQNSSANLKSDITRSPFQILLYYLYRSLADAAGYFEEHRILCERLGLRGRILIAEEGLNGTVSGSRKMTEEYMSILQKDERTRGIEFKVDSARDHAFPKLDIKLRNEVVTLALGEDDFSPTEGTGRHLSPTEWRVLMEKEDAVMIDVRNQYEWELGHFEGALLPRVQSFREFPEWVRRNRAQLKGKKILTYCTGGVRCEKFSGFLLREGFEEVFQLGGGIVSYGRDPAVQGEKFAGKCYVFDERIGVEVNRTVDATIISRCDHCGTSCDRYVNCSWSHCNRQHFCCEACEDDVMRYCNPVCRKAALVSLAAQGNASD